MSPSFNIQFLIAWGVAIISLIAFVLLGKKMPKAWFLVGIQPTWYIISLFLSPMGFDSYSFEILASNGFILFLVVYGYTLWQNTEPISYTSSLDGNTDILDSIETKHTNFITKRLSADTIIDPITFAIIFFVSWGFVKVAIFAYPMDFFYALYHANEIISLLGLYLLAKHYIEGWFCLAIVTITPFILSYAAEFYLYANGIEVGYAIVSLLVYGWGYLQWKKLES